MASTMTYLSAPEVPPFTTPTINLELPSNAPRDIIPWENKHPHRAFPKTAEPYRAFPKIGSEPTTVELIFSTLNALIHTNTLLRNRQIADRLLELYRAALADKEDILPQSITQFRDFFLQHPDLGFPRITLTPDGTLRVRWIHGRDNFVAIEFLGRELVKLVAEIPKDDGGTERHFSTELVQSVVEAARAIGGSFA